MGNAQRSLAMDPSVYGQGMMQSKPGIGSAGTVLFLWQEKVTK